MDVDKLVKALDNENNQKIMSLTTKKINKMKIDILKELHLPVDEITDYLKKLDRYKYVDEIDDFQYGCFIRWIPLNEPDNIHLTKGAHFCEVKINDDGIYIVYKTFANRHYQLKMDENLIFQKLSGQEEVLLLALDHLSSK